MSRNMINRSQKVLLGRSISIALLSLTAAACGGGAGADADGTNNSVLSPLASGPRTYPDQPIDCSLPEMRNWVEANMFDYYLFYDQVAPLNKADYDSPEALLNDMRVTPFDRFSFIGDAQASTALFDEGKLHGYG